MLEPNTTMFLTPLLLAAILGLPPLLVLAHSRAQLDKELAALPTPDPNTTGADLSPTELAYLCGGEQRAAETTLTGLHLDGHLRPHPQNPEPALNGEAEDNAPDSADPLKNTLVAALQNTRDVHTLDLLAMARSHPEMAQIRAKLAERGLLADSDELRRALRRRSGAQTLSVFGVVTGFLAVTTGALGTGMGEIPDGLLNGVVAGGLALSLLGAGALLTAVLTGGWRPSTLSSAGADLARASRTQYGNTPANPPAREETLRRTAVHGPRHPETPDGKAKNEIYASKD